MPSTRAVHQFSISGELIQTYPSLTAARKATGVAHQSIGQCAKGIVCTAGGYVWQYAEYGKEFRGNLNERSADRSMYYAGKPIEQLNLDGEVIATFDSVVKAAKALNIPQNVIYSALRRIPTEKKWRCRIDYPYDFRYKESA